MTEATDAALSLSPVEPPRDAPLEVARMRRNVRSQLFGGDPQPTRIGRFRLLECIGRGGMGVVWSARDDELDRTVAIKLLRPELSGSDLTAEARALARLAHPNVVSVFDVGVHEGQRFIAMEFVRGQTLRRWLATAPSLEAVLDVFAASGRGLAAAHAVELVHRDFKPDNVLVGEDGRPRVLDFGLARPPDGEPGSPPAVPLDANPLATTLTQAGLLVGTPAYMAPEQHLGDPADARSDQFAFAVALYEALVGQLPFRGDDLRTLSLAIVRGRISPPPAGVVPPPVAEVLARALAVSPADRFASMDALLDALDHCRQRDAVRFDTRQVDQVLARAAELQSASSGRPGLSPAEVEAAAVEAGIDPEHARRAAHEALLPAPREPAATPAAPSTSAAPRPPLGLRRFDYDVTFRRHCGVVDGHVAELMVREMDRREGPGKTDVLGANMTWHRRALELYVDPTESGTSIMLRRRLGALSRIKPWAFGALGIIVTLSVVMPIVVELFDDSEAVITMMVFIGLFNGAWWGRHFAHWLHQRTLDQGREELSRIADRLNALAVANTSRPRPILPHR